MSRSSAIAWASVAAIVGATDGACSRPETRLNEIEVRVQPLTAALEVAAPQPPPLLFASKQISKVRSAPSKDAPRLGYLRAGTTLAAKTAEPLGFDDCRKGWFELASGGFVCATTDFAAYRGDQLAQRAPTPPDLHTRLPYPYGYSRSRGTPVYRRPPTDAEAALYEPGFPGAAGSAALTREGPAAGPPTLASLLAAERGVLLRRMERGFYVSLDREIERNGRSYWQTQAAGYIPKARLMVIEGADFHGVDLVQSGLALPLGYVVSTARTRAYVVDTRGHLRGTQSPEYHAMFPIVGQSMLHNEPLYVAANALQYRARGVTRIDRRDKPPEVADAEKWIDVDLSTQSLVAYVGPQPVYATLISSGRIEDERDPTRNFVTPAGSFRISSKHLTATMDGDHAIDGPYSIEDVPYVMYFQLAYALHAAFWHNAFGRPRSHGCINLAPEDARWLFFWVDPQLPKAWHGVYPNAQASGTRLFVRGETPNE